MASSAIPAPQGISIADDFPNSSETTGVVQINMPANLSSISRIYGSIEAVGDVDLLKVDLVAGQTYFMNATSRTGAGVIDPLLLLWDSEFVLLDGNDDATAFTSNAQIRFTAATTGTYYLQVSDLTDRRTGNYTASVWQVGADLYGDTTGTAGTTTVGTTKTGLLETRQDIDVFAITLEQGSVYTFDLATPTGALDPVLTLLDSAGVEIMFSDDGAQPGWNSQIVFRAATSGVFYLRVEDFSDSEGAYSLKSSVLTKSINGTSVGNAINGTDAAEAIYGLAGNDAIHARGGNDYVDGGFGADYMYGEGGDDTFIVDNVRDTVIELADAGNDMVQTNLVSFALNANVERLIYTGSSTFTGLGNDLDNILQGGVGNDRLNGGAGSDKLYGGAGDDTYVVDDVNDLPIERIGQGSVDLVISSIDWVLGANLEDLQLAGDAEMGDGNELNNRLTGNNGANHLEGLAGNDTLSGGNGDDTLHGGVGNDRLYGGRGMDVLCGDEGRDSFVFNTLPRSQTNVDTIADFSAFDDSFRLDNAVFTAFEGVIGRLAAGRFCANETGEAVDRNDNIVFNTLTGELSYDADGSGEQEAVLFAVIDLDNLSGPVTASDFLIF